MQNKPKAKSKKLSGKPKEAVSIYVRIEKVSKAGKDTVQHTAETSEEAVQFITKNA